MLPGGPHTSCKWSWNPFTWPYKWVTWVRTLLIGELFPYWQLVVAHLVGVLCCFFLLRGKLVHRVEIDMELKMKDLNILTQIFQYILSFDYEKSWHLFEFHVNLRWRFFLLNINMAWLDAPSYTLSLRFFRFPTGCDFPVGSNAPALQRPKSWREYLVKFRRDLTRPNTPKGSWERESPQNSHNFGLNNFIW